MSGGNVVGVPDGPRWRCPTCTFLNTLTTESCRRCREPTTEEQRLVTYKFDGAAPQRGDSRQSSWHTPVSPQRARGGGSGRGKSVKAATATATATRRTSASGRAKQGAIHTLKKKKKKKSGGVKKPAAGRVRPKDDFHKGDLGYKPKKGGNVRTFTRSRLREATAAYAAKYENDEEAAKDGQRKNKRGGTVATLGSMNVNGFTKSSAAMARSRAVRTSSNEHDKKPAPRPRARRSTSSNAHDNKPAPRPAKYARGGRGGGGLIARLQAAASTGTVASLKARNRGRDTHKATTKSLGKGGGYSKLAL